MGDVAVVLLARRQGEVVVGELEMEMAESARSACVLAAALQWQQRLYTSHHMEVFLSFQNN